jgi:DNA uptake protein ComE-like DNA-binding protein
MKFSLIRGRFAFTSFLVLLLAMLSTSVAGAQTSSSAGELLFWLMGLNKARDQGAPEKLDINSASVEQLAAVPGLDRRQAGRIAALRPYTKLEDLTRAGVSSHSIERLAGMLTVSQSSPSASPRPANPRND